MSKISIFGFLFFKSDGVDRSRVPTIKSGVFLASEKILAILDTPQGLHGKNPHPWSRACVCRPMAQARSPSTPLEALPKGRPLVVVSTKLVELAPRNMARTIEKVTFGTPLDRGQKLPTCTTLRSSWEPHGLTEVLAFLSRLLSSKIELRRVVPHNPHTHADNFFLSCFEPIFASNSKTAHFERKRWAPPFKPCPRGVHWWWSRPNWLSWHREKWIGPSKNGNLGPLWMETKNSFLGLRKENATLAWFLPFCHFFLDQNGAKLSCAGDFHDI